MAKAAGAYTVEDGEIDLRSLGAALWRRKLWIIVPTLFAAIAAGIVVNVMTPRYKSEARIVYDGRENVFLRPDADKSLNQDRSPADPETLTDQVQIVLSRDLALTVIGDLKLNEKPEFDRLLRGQSVFRHLLTMVGLSRDFLAMSPEERVLESWFDRLTVYSVDKSRVIVIEFLSADPMLAARITNAIAADYLRRQQLVRQDQTRGAGEWLAKQIESLRPKVADAEAKAEGFRADTNLMVGTNNTTLSNQQLGEINSQFAAAVGQKADAETRARIIRDMLRQGVAIDASDVVNSELIRRLSEQRVILRGQLAEQSSTLLDGHPRIKELKAQIADLDRQIRSEAEKLARTFDNDARIATARLDAMTGNLNALKRQAASTNVKDVEYRALEREAKAQRDLLESYLAKYRETTARDTIGNAPPDAKIISPAFVSNTPAFPRKVPIIAIATLLAFVLSSGWVTTGELMRAVGGTVAVARPEPTARAEPALMAATLADAPPSPVRAPLIVGTERNNPEQRNEARQASRSDEGASPAVMDAPSLAADPPLDRSVRGEDGRAAGPYRGLGLPFGSIPDIARRLRANPGPGNAVVLVGGRPDVVTAGAALTLARALAADAKVVIVGLVKGSAALDATAASPDMPGVSDIVVGTATFGQIIGKDKLSRVHLIGYGQAAVERQAILGSRQFDIMLRALSRAYRHVVIDGGMLAGDCILLSAVVPRAVLLAPDQTPEQITVPVELLKGAGFADIAVMTGELAPGMSTGLAAA